MDIQALIPANITVLYKHYRTYIMGALIGVVGCIGLVVYMHMERTKREEMAQSALSETFIEFNRAQQNRELWQDVEIAAKTGYRQYKKTTLAPYFLIAQAQALFEQNKTAEAIPLMTEAVSYLKNTPVYHLYAITLSRMKLSCDDAALKAQGLQQLEALAHDKQIMVQDEALYYLGLHYAYNDEFEKAREQWQELIATFKHDKEGVSPWVAAAERKLQELA